MRKRRMFNAFAITTIAASLAVAGSSSPTFGQTTTDLSRVLPLVRPDGTTVGGNPDTALPKGTVKLEIKGGTQKFTIDADNLTGSYAKGLAVYVGTDPQITNGVIHFINVLSQTNSNGHWRLAFESSPGAPPQLGVTNLTDLVGMTVFVASETNNALLRANVTPLVPNPAKLSFKRRVPLSRPDAPPSQKAKGTILVRYNGRTGASTVDIRARHLNANNRYMENDTLTNCVATGVMAANGAARWRNDTGLGDELVSIRTEDGVKYGSDFWITTAWDEIGHSVAVLDCFGGVHLYGTIPGPKK